MVFETASPRFKSLRRAQQDNPSAEYRDELLVIPVQETATVLYGILQWIYATPTPMRVSNALFVDVACAAERYGMTVLDEQILGAFARRCEQDPFAMYTLAANANWKRGILSAAKACLCLNLSIGTLTRVHNLGNRYHLGAIPLRRLEIFRRESGTSVASLLLEPGSSFLNPFIRMLWLDDGNLVWFTCARSCPTQVPIEDIRICWNPTVAPIWWTKVIRKLAEMLRTRPAPSTVLSPALEDNVVQVGTAACPHCAEKVREHWKIFAQGLAKQVERVIGEVSGLLLHVGGYSACA